MLSYLETFTVKYSNLMRVAAWAAEIMDQSGVILVPTMQGDLDKLIEIFLFDSLSACLNLNFKVIEWYCSY